VMAKFLVLYRGGTSPEDVDGDTMMAEWMT
jgi:hypothetical protein